MIEQGAQTEDESTTPSFAGWQLPSFEMLFDAAALPILLQRMAATPFDRCPGQKSKLGALNSPSLRRWIMKSFRVKNIYAPPKRRRV